MKHCKLSHYPYSVSSFLWISLYYLAWKNYYVLHSTSINWTRKLNNGWRHFHSVVSSTQWMLICLPLSEGHCVVHSVSVTISPTQWASMCLPISVSSTQWVYLLPFYLFNRYDCFISTENWCIHFLTLLVLHLFGHRCNSFTFGIIYFCDYNLAGFHNCSTHLFIHQ